MKKQFFTLDKVFAIEDTFRKKEQFPIIDGESVGEYAQKVADAIDSPKEVIILFIREKVKKGI